MTDFDAASVLFGGALIGVTATPLMLLVGRIAGVSGVPVGVLESARSGCGTQTRTLAGTWDDAWRAWRCSSIPVQYL
jgi:hypothetical protein